jgi:polyisoprenoid-binding protein YceI
VTKQVELPFTLNQADSNGKKKLGIDTELGINRFDYHVNFDPSGTTVSKDVKIEINLEANAQ